jgi:hypothetical protein
VKKDMGFLPVAHSRGPFVVCKVSRSVRAKMELLEVEITRQKPEIARIASDIVALKKMANKSSHNDD